MSSINGSATTSAVNVVENKITNNIDLVKNTDCDIKMSDIKIKYFTTSDYNKFKE